MTIIEIRPFRNGWKCDVGDAEDRDPAGEGAAAMRERVRNRKRDERDRVNLFREHGRAGEQEEEQRPSGRGLSRKAPANCLEDVCGRKAPGEPFHVMPRAAEFVDGDRRWEAKPETRGQGGSPRRHAEARENEEDQKRAGHRRDRIVDARRGRRHPERMRVDPVRQDLHRNDRRARSPVPEKVRVGEGGDRVGNRRDRSELQRVVFEPPRRRRSQEERHEQGGGRDDGESEPSPPCRRLTVGGRHRKRESQHRVPGCGASRSRLRC